jgi:predicted transcriptional regulator
MSRTILLSIKPCFSELIKNGTKQVEIRRVWPVAPTTHVVIYESSPTQRIVAMAKVLGVEKMTPSRLWEHSRGMGPGLTRKEFMEYLNGKKFGFAVALEEVSVLNEPILPRRIVTNFVAPQSFRYLTPRELTKAKKIFEQEG